LLVAVGLAILVPRLGQVGFWDPWEPKYAQTVREMTDRGSYLVPYYDDKVRMAKPILVYWGIMAGSAVFGLNELGARAAGVLAAIAAMLVTYRIVSTLRGRRAGLLSALVLGTSPQFYFIARQAMPDVYLFASLGASVLFLALALYGPGKTRHFVASYVCLGIAILAKGPLVALPIYLASLAICGFCQLDLHRLWRPELRRETLRTLGLAIPAALALLLLPPVAFVFTAPVSWLGYSTRTRAKAGAIRSQLVDLLDGIHAGEALLVLVTGAALFGLGLRLVRRDARRHPATTVLHATAAIVGLAAWGCPPALRLGLAATSGILLALALLAVAWRRMGARPEVRDLLGPVLRPLRRQAALGAAVVGLIAGPWFLAVLFLESRSFVSDFLVYNNLRRVTSEINQTGQADFYVRTLIFGLFPWSALIPVVLVTLLGRSRNPLRRPGPEAYLLVVAAVAFVLFSAIVTKFAHYQAVALIPWAALIGTTLSRLLDLRHTPLARLAWIGATMFLLVPLLDLLRDDGGLLLATFTVKQAVPDTAAPGPAFVAALLLMAVLMLAGIVWQSRAVVCALVATAVLFAIYNTTVFVPAVTRIKTMKNLCETWRRERARDEPICFYGPMKHGVNFYTAGEIERVGNLESFAQFMNPARPAFCIVEKEKLDAARERYTAAYGQQLQVVDRSHTSHVLVNNHLPAPDR
jgi:4-amino-4-deoxy-L-arabinose transferase-like glycosyltransferase